MKINFARLQDFRNIEFAEVPFRSRSAWIFGGNAQGKTNLLEALGTVGALRSFRTRDTKALVAHGKTCARILAGVEHEKFGECEILVEISAKHRVYLDGAECKYSEYIGKFPVLALCSADIGILRESPEFRRRGVDMLLSSLDGLYLDSLRRYHLAMSRRNALLKSPGADAAVFSAFEREMAEAAHSITRIRGLRLPELGGLASQKYAVLAGKDGEAAQMKIKCSCLLDSAEAFAEMFERERRLDADFGYTRKGPHRDDFRIEIAGKDAKLYASEGQQRSAVLALRLGEFEMQKSESGVEPVILCDDVLGELDATRRAAFWECVPEGAQVVASSTLPPPRGGARSPWQTVEAKAGSFKAEG